MLIRDGIARLLEEAGMRVVAQAGSPDELLEHVAEKAPDVAVVDIRMPPSGTDEGVNAAKTIRRLHPDTGVLLLSQDLVPAYARELLEASDGGVGYLLKDRVADMTEFADAIRRIADGEVVLDAEIDAIAGCGPELRRGRFQRADEAEEPLERRGVELAPVLAQRGDQGELAAGLILLGLHGTVALRGPAQRSFRAKDASAAAPTRAR